MLDCEGYPNAYLETKKFKFFSKMHPSKIMKSKQMLESLRNKENIVGCCSSR